MFSKTYDGKKPANEAWKSITKTDHEKLEQELDLLKKAYLVEFKKFLEGLNKKQLKQFADMRKNRKSSDSEENGGDDTENENREVKV